MPPPSQETGELRVTKPLSLRERGWGEGGRSRHAISARSIPRAVIAIDEMPMMGFAALYPS